MPGSVETGYRLRHQSVIVFLEHFARKHTHRTTHLVGIGSIEIVSGGLDWEIRKRHPLLTGGEQQHSYQQKCKPLMVATRHVSEMHSAHQGFGNHCGQIAFRLLFQQFLCQFRLTYRVLVCEIEVQHLLGCHLGTQQVSVLLVLQGVTCP